MIPSVLAWAKVELSKNAVTIILSILYSSYTAAKSLAPGTVERVPYVEFANAEEVVVVGRQIWLNLVRITPLDRIIVRIDGEFITVNVVVAAELDDCEEDDEDEDEDCTWLRGTSTYSSVIICFVVVIFT